MKIVKKGYLLSMTQENKESYMKQKYICNLLCFKDTLAYTSVSLDTVIEAKTDKQTQVQTKPHNLKLVNYSY